MVDETNMLVCAHATEEAVFKQLRADFHIVAPILPNKFTNKIVEIGLEGVLSSCGICFQ